jgi:hypothetical protein
MTMFSWIITLSLLISTGIIMFLQVRLLYYIAREVLMYGLIGMVHSWLLQARMVLKSWLTVKDLDSLEHWKGVIMRHQEGKIWSMLRLVFSAFYEYLSE